MNTFMAWSKLHYRPLRVDGVMGAATRRRIREVRYFIGVGPGHTDGQRDDITDALLSVLPHYKRRMHGETRVENLARRRTAAGRMKRRRKAVKEHKQVHVKGTSAGAPHWGGSVYVVLLTRPIAARYGHPVTSTKRWPPVNGNFGSWHNTSQTQAWADDYGTFNGADHAQAIRSYWGNHAEASGTYAIYFVEVDGRIYRKQTLWAVEGHFNHVHDGAAV